MKRKRVSSGLLAILLLSACVADTGFVSSTTTPPPVAAETPITSEPATTSTTDTPTPGQPTTTTTSPSTTTQSEEEPTGEITVEGSTVEGGGLIDVALGQEVRILVIADTVDMAHLHGYDIAVDVGPDLVGTLEFVADIPGLFELELEDSGLELGTLQVSP